MSRAVWWLFGVAAVMPLSARQPAQAQEELYRVATFCTPYPAHTRPPIVVSDGAELQNALDDAKAGDTIALTPGATFVPVAPEGSFVLRNRSIPPGQWVIVRSASSAFDANGAIPPNRRVRAEDATHMPRLRGERPVLPVIKTASGARGYRLVGLDIGVDPQVSQVTALVELGDGGDTSAATEPSDIVIDRSYLHGNDEGNFRRGVAMNGVRLAVIESHLENFHDANSDSQAIAGWNGPGPFRIVNNFLEAASENIMFGGGDPRIAGLVPSDIEIRRNLSTKRLSWKAAKVAVKNAFELKNARRVLVEGNIFEHVWASGQDGTAIVVKSTNQEGRCPHCVTEFVTFRHNVVRGAASGVVINATEVGRKGLPHPQPVNHIRFHNNLFVDLGGEWGPGAKLLRVFGGVTDVEFTHNTAAGNARGILDPRDVSDRNPNLVFSFNIVERGMYGIGAGGDEGVTTLTRNFPRHSYEHNVLVNTSDGTDQQISDGALRARYPSPTSVARDWESVGFVAGTYKLAPDSAYQRAAENGRDIGVDIDAMEAAQRGPGGSGACGPEMPARPAPVPRRPIP